MLWRTCRYNETFGRFSKVAEHLGDDVDHLRFNLLLGHADISGWTPAMRCRLVMMRPLPAGLRWDSDSSRYAGSTHANPALSLITGPIMARRGPSGAVAPSQTGPCEPVRGIVLRKTPGFGV